MRLETQPTILHCFVRNLLASEIPDSDIEHLLILSSSKNSDPAPNPGWKDPALEKALKEKLGADRHENMIRILEEVARILKDLDKEL